MIIDKRFSYYTDVMRWDTCQVTDERTLENATDKTKSWTVCPDMLVSFSLSREESNKAAVVEKQPGKGAKRRQPSAPPDSDTARAKQSKKDADAAQAEKQDPKDAPKKGRPRALSRSESTAISNHFLEKIKEQVPNLRPKGYRSLLALGADWYRFTYHTRYSVTKQTYLAHLHDKAVGDFKVKETNTSLVVQPFVKALGLLKSAVADPKSIGLFDPHPLPPDSAQGQKRPVDTTASQGQSKAKRGSSAPVSYSGAAKGSADGKSQPIGAKIVQTEPPKASAKSASGAIGAPAPAKAPTSEATKEPDPSITPDTAFQYLEQSGGTETFGEFQGRSKGQTVQAKTQMPVAPNISHTDVDQDDIDLQRAPQESRQQTQMEGSDPAASSSTSATIDGITWSRATTGNDASSPTTYCVGTKSGSSNSTTTTTADADAKANSRCCPATCTAKTTIPTSTRELGMEGSTFSVRPMAWPGLAELGK